MPNCGVGYFLDVVQIVGELLQKYSNLNLIGIRLIQEYLWMIVLGIWRQELWGKLRRKSVGEI